MILLLAAVMLLSGCGNSGGYVASGNGFSDQTTSPSLGNETESQSLSLVYNPQKSLNPYTCADYTNKLLFSLLYQSLFTVDADYQVEPQLCKTYTVSKDRKTYVFYIEQATFADGSALTATDVMVSLEAARNGVVYKGRFGNVDSIRLTADGGVQVELTTAYENFPLLLTVPIVRASQVDENLPDGTGPYERRNTGSGYQLLLRKNWWCTTDLPIYAEKIPLVAAEDPKSIRDEFELGDTGVVCANPGSDTYVDFRSDYDLWDCENGIFLYLGCRAKSKVFSNQTVRQALTHAIDRTALVRDYYRTFAMAATLPASPNSPYYDRNLASAYGFDREKFTDALIQEGLEGSSIVLLVNKDDSRRVKVAQAIKTMLEACTLEVTVKALSGEDYTNSLKYATYDLHLGQTVLSPNMDLSVFYDSDGALNYNGISDGDISALCKEALANSGNYQSLHKAVMKDAMLCPVAFLSYAVYVKSDLVDNLNPARDNIFYYSLGKTMKDAFQKA